MEGVYITSTSQDQSYDYWNITYDYDYIDMIAELNDYYNKFNFIMKVLTYIIIAVSLPLTLVTIYALYSMVRRDHVAPIYVINLLISDLIQLCCMIVQVVPNVDWRTHYIFLYIYYSGLFTSLYFMVCIALERYLVIAHPLWYRFRTIKTSVAVCVLVWVLSPVCATRFYFFVDNLGTYITFAVLFLLPFPLLIFFLVGTLKALSASTSVPSEKQRTVGILVLVLLIYTLLFLPNIIWYLEDLKQKYDENLDSLSFIFVKFSPLADSVLYVFMRKGTVDKLLASVCCCRMDSSDISSPSV